MIIETGNCTALKLKDLGTNLAVLTVWLAIFIPGHLYGWWVERSFSVLLLLVAVTSIIVSPLTLSLNFIGRINKLILMVLLAVSSLYTFSLLSAGHSLITRDLFELPRYIVVGAIFVIMGNADPYRLKVSAEKLILTSLTFSLAMFFLYLVDVPILSEIISWIYEDTKTVISFPNWIRLAIPFENPNFLAFYTVLCLAYAMFFMQGRRRIVLVGIALVVLLATGSRSGWLTFMMIFLGFSVRVFPGVINNNRRRIKSDFVFLCAFMFLTAVIFYFLYPYLIQSSRVQMVLHAVASGGITHEPNLAGRLDMIYRAYELFSQKPLLGWGACKGGGLAVIDNQYFSLIARQGLAGFILIMGLMLFVMRGSIRSMQTKVDKYGVVIMWLATGLMLCTGAFFDNFRLLTLFIFILIAVTGREKPPYGEARKYRF